MQTRSVVNYGRIVFSLFSRLLVKSAKECEVKWLMSHAGNCIGR